MTDKQFKKNTYNLLEKNFTTSEEKIKQLKDVKRIMNDLIIMYKSEDILK